MSDKYALVQQMKSEKCEATANIESYLTWENITIIKNRQYEYYKAPLELVKRNYVCPSSKRTYSLDFMYEEYVERKTLLQNLVEMQEDLSHLYKELEKNK